MRTTCRGAWIRPPKRWRKSTCPHPCRGFFLARHSGHGRRSRERAETEHNRTSAPTGTAGARGASYDLALTTGLGAAALGLSAAAVLVSLSSPFGSQRAIVGALHALLIATPVLVGLYALRRDIQPRFAWVLIAFGFGWAPSLLAASGDGVLYSIGRIGSWIGVLSLIAVLLAFPSGRLTRRVDRILVAAGCALVVFLYLPTVPLTERYPDPSPWSACRHDCPTNAFSAVASEPHVVSTVISPAREIGATALFLAAALALASRAPRASRPMRRTLTPALIAALLALMADGAFVIARRADQWSSLAEILGYVAVLAIPGVLVGLLVGLFRWRFVASSARRRLIDQFSGVRSGSALRALLADAIRDPSLEIAYWTGEPGGWVDQEGTPIDLPLDDPARAVTEITSSGHTIAALVHDAALVAEPTVREVAGGFALMALENLRLDADLRSSLRELRESRARILSSVDLERQRIERDLHDGAQQRLVALRVALQVAREVLEDDPRAAGDMLDKLGGSVEATLDEVRALARGVYPPLLADHGIAEALRMAARTSPLPVTVTSRGLGRYSQQIESAVYFCCLEALQNAAKHSGAHAINITLSEDDELHFEVLDDGEGLAVSGIRGAGLDNMRDRIVALGGRLAIESPPGGGTRVAGTVPVGLAQLTPDVAGLLQRATDALDDCFAIYSAVRDSSGTVIDFAVEHVNDAACRDTGRSRELQIGRTLGYLDPGYLDSALFEWHREALELDGPSSLDEVFYDRSAAGRSLRKAYEVRAVPMGGGRLAVTWREITERKRKEDDLLLKSTVLNRVAEPVCLVRAADGVIVYANPRFEEVLGYEPGELLGHHISELNWEDEPGDADHTPGGILAHIDEHVETSYEVLNRRKDGTPMWTEVRASPLEHADHGKVWVLVKHDISARKPAGQARLRSRRARTR